MKVAPDERPVEGLLRELAPQVLGAVTRRFRDFADAEDAVQEALLAAATAWPASGVPDNPRGWLVAVAHRRMTDRFRSEGARRRREDLAASREPVDAEPGPDSDDSLVLLFLCCHPSLSPPSAIALTLRAVGGLTTAEIAAAFLVPEATMAQRISRAKARLRDEAVPFRLPNADDRAVRLRSVLHVLYLLFNEGYVSTRGAELSRPDLSGEAIRLTRVLHAGLPHDPEVTGVLALMLLTDARRAARTAADGALVPLAEQDRRRWDQAQIAEGVGLVTQALAEGAVGEYQLQAAIAAAHDTAARHEDTDWSQIAGLYQLLERISGNPMVTLNRAVAVAMADGPEAGLALLEPLDERLGTHHRLSAVRAHLLEMAGHRDAAIEQYRLAAGRTASTPEQRYLVLRAARLAADG